MTQKELETVIVQVVGALSMHIAIEMPFDIQSISCPTHTVQIKKTLTKAMVRLATDQGLSSGFQLQISVAEIHVPRMWVEKLPESDSQACMLTFYPEFEAIEEEEAEVIFLLDSSNSMKHEALKDAKKILLLCLHHFPPQWLFNIVTFGTNLVYIPAGYPRYRVTSCRWVGSAGDEYYGYIHGKKKKTLELMNN
ncbi:hypothetical protein ScPMuIL_011864 [Solemya velum]